MRRLFSGILVILLFTFGLGTAAPLAHQSSPMEEVVGVVDAVKKEFPAIKSATVQEADLKPNIYAVTEWSPHSRKFTARIVFNAQFFNDRNRLESFVDNDVTLGFHPSLGHCTAAQYIAYHESAHLVDVSEHTAAHNALFNRFGDGHQLHGILSGYSFFPVDMPDVGALLNPSESLAEAFASVHCNGGNATERELNNMLTLLGEIHELR